MNTLNQKYPEEVAKILAKYPADQKRSAVMPLLHMSQQENGYITRQSLEDIAEICGVTATEVASVVGFYTLYHDHPGGKHRIQVCTDLACSLRGADDFLKNLCENIGIKVGETTPDGLFSIEEVTCLAGCDHAPMFQVQSGDDLAYHEDQTVESVKEWMDEIRRKEGGKEAAE